MKHMDKLSLREMAETSEFALAEYAEFCETLWNWITENEGTEDVYARAEEHFNISENDLVDAITFYREEFLNDFEHY